MKKIISIILAMILAVSFASMLVSADTFTDKEILPGKLIDFDLKKGDAYEYTFTPSIGKGGEYTFISFGEGSPSVTVSYVKKAIIGKDETVSTTIGSENGAIFGTYSFTVGTSYKIRVTSANGEAAKFSLIYFIPDASKCGFSSDPVKTSYFDKLEVNINGSTAEFINDSLDLTGAVFDLVDSTGTVIYSVKGNSIKKIIGSITYSNNTIKLAVNASKKFLSWTVKEYSSISLEVKAYPIASVRLNHDDLVYTYGKDGKIKGNINSSYFVPNIKFNEMTADVTLTSGEKYEQLPIKSAKGKYYFEVEGVGKVYITNNAQCTEKGTVDADVTVGATPYKLTVTIKKPGFFDSIAIWFKLLFGVYNK